MSRELKALGFAPRFQQLPRRLELSDEIVEPVGRGTDTVTARWSYALGAGVSVEKLQTISATANFAVDLTGNEIDNTIIGNAGVNTLDGGAGADYMEGWSGDEVLLRR